MNTPSPEVAEAASTITNHTEGNSVNLGPARLSAGPGGPQRLTPLRAGEAELFTNGLRVYLQRRTFTAQESFDVALQLLGSFALDAASDDRFKAAARVRRGTKSLVSQIEAGTFRIIRTKEGA